MTGPHSAPQNTAFAIAGTPKGGSGERSNPCHGTRCARCSTQSSGWCTTTIMPAAAKVARRTVLTLRL